MGDDRPNPLSDVIKGLGLLLRAAKTTVQRGVERGVENLPTKDIEEVVLTSAREVGRALENVATTVEREVFGRRDAPTKPTSEGPAASGANAPPKAKEPEKEEPKPPDAA
jgi:hypothetical protein